MLPSINTDLRLYLGLFAALAILIILATLWLDDSVEETRENGTWALALVVAQRASPLTLGALGVTFVIVESGALLIDPIKWLIRRLGMIRHWLAVRKRQKELAKELKRAREQELRRKAIEDMIVREQERSKRDSNE